LTKWYDDQHKYRQDPGTPIVAGRDWYGEPQREFYCEYCQRRLSRLTSHGLSPSWYCSFCQIESIPDEKEMRSKGKLETMPGPPDTPLATTKFKEPTVGRTPPPIRGSFAELQRRGIKITNYKDTVKS
jgi:hypothetical protein